MDTGADQLNPTEVVDLFNTVGVFVQSRLWLLERTGLLFNLGVEESILSLETDCESLGESFANLSNLVRILFENTTSVNVAGLHLDWPRLGSSINFSSILIFGETFGLILHDITKLGDTNGSDTSVKDDIKLKSGVDSLEYAPESYSEITEDEDE